MKTLAHRPAKGLSALVVRDRVVRRLHDVSPNCRGARLLGRDRARRRHRGADGGLLADAGSASSADRPVSPHLDTAT